MKGHSLEHLLDACLAELNGGEDLERVLSNYPQHADELRPMLAAASWMSMDIPAPTRRAEGKAAFMQSVATRRRQVEQTDGYVVELKAGVPLDQLVARATPVMRPLLLAAWRMFQAEVPEANAQKRAAGKDRIMAMAAARRRARQTAIVPRPIRRVYGQLVALADGFAASSHLTRRASAGIAAIAMVAVLMGGGVVGVTQAAASSLPGQPLYTVKRLSESARLLMARDASSRAELVAEFGSARLHEMARLAEDGLEPSVAAFVEWLEADTQALTEVHALTAAQQDALAEAILSLSGGHSPALVLAVHDVRELELLVNWSEQRLAAAKRSSEIPDLKLDAATGQLQLHTDRILPADDLAPTGKAPAPSGVTSGRNAGAGLVAPAMSSQVPAPASGLAGQPSGASQVMQAGESSSDEDRQSDEDRETESAATGETPTAPPFGQVGGDQPIPPTDEPPLQLPPGGSGEALPPAQP